MRDIIRFPITNEEIVECLRGFLAEVDPNKTHLVGDMRPLLLGEAIAIITTQEANLAIVQNEAMDHAIKACGKIAAARERQSHRDIAIECMTAIEALKPSGPVTHSVETGADVWPFEVQKHVIRLAHFVGLHDDRVFHTECPICVEKGVALYVAEGQEILRAADRSETEISGFDAYIRSFPEVSSLLHEEPVYLVASYLGIRGTGSELEADRDFLVLDAAAQPIRLRRLATTASPD
jgi:hypothetical protein